MENLVSAKPSLYRFEKRVSAYLENDQFQLCDVVRVDPVFRGLADKILLRPSGCGITLDGISLGPDQIVELREFHNKRIVIILEERLSFEARGEDGPQVPAGLFLAKLAHGRSWAETRKATNTGAT